jgi:hypothetical protein
MHVCEFDHTDAAISGLASGRFSSFITCGGGPSTTATSIYGNGGNPLPLPELSASNALVLAVVVVPLYPEFVLIKKENERAEPRPTS